jgi:hypothetical protein
MAKTLIELFRERGYPEPNKNLDTTPISDQDNNYDPDPDGAFLKHTFKDSKFDPRGIGLIRPDTTPISDQDNNYDPDPNGAFLGNTTDWRYFSSLSNYQHPIDLLDAINKKTADFNFFNNVSVFGRKITDNAVFGVPKDKVPAFFSPFLERLSADTDGRSIRITSQVELNNPMLYGSDILRIGNRSTPITQIMKLDAGGENSNFSLNLGPLINKIQQKVGKIIGLPQPPIPTYVKNYKTFSGDDKPLIAKNVRYRRTHLELIKRGDNVGNLIGDVLSKATGTPEMMVNGLIQSTLDKATNFVRGVIFGGVKDGKNVVDIVDTQLSLPVGAPPVIRSGNHLFDYENPYSSYYTDKKREIDENSVGLQYHPTIIKASPIYGLCRKSNPFEPNSIDGKFGNSENAFYDSCYGYGNYRLLNKKTPTFGYREIEGAKFSDDAIIQYNSSCNYSKDYNYGVRNFASGSHANRWNVSANGITVDSTQPHNHFSAYDGCDVDTDYVSKCATLMGSLVSCAGYRDRFLNYLPQGGWGEFYEKPDTQTPTSGISLNTINRTVVDYSPVPFWILDVRYGFGGMIFKTIISGITETFSPEWNSSNFVGNPYKYYTYYGIERKVSFDLKVIAESPEQLPENWDKLTRLAKLTYPTFSTVSNSKMITPPILRFRLGDLYNDKHGYVDTLTFTINEDSGWETVEGLILPKYIDVNIGITFIEDVGSEDNLYNYDTSNKTTIKSITDANANITSGSFSQKQKDYDNTISQTKTFASKILNGLPNFTSQKTEPLIPPQQSPLETKFTPNPNQNPLTKLKSKP